MALKVRETNVYTIAEVMDRQTRLHERFSIQTVDLGLVRKLADGSFEVDMLSDGVVMSTVQGGPDTLLRLSRGN
jgi:hypothetical protein